MGVTLVARDEEFLGDACRPICFVLEAQRTVQPDGRSGHPPSARVGRDQLGSPLGSSGGIEGLENCRVRRKCSAGRSRFGRPRLSFDEIHNEQGVCETSLEPNSDKIRRRFSQMGRGLWSERDHNSSLLRSSLSSAVRCALANPIVAGNSKSRQMAQREKCQRVRKASSVAQGNLEAVGSMDNW